jgi:hypothetical protein
MKLVGDSRALSLTPHDLAASPFSPIMATQGNYIMGKDAITQKGPVALEFTADAL